MPAIDPVGGMGGTQPPSEPSKSTTAQGPWEKRILSGYMAIVEMIEALLGGSYIPDLKDASLLAQAAKTIFQFLSQDPKSYMHNIDKLLTHFLNGWHYLKEYAAKLKKEHKPIPVFLQKILNNPQFKKLASTLEQMAKIEKDDPDYKNNPQWKKLEKDVVGKGGLLDQIYALGQKDKVLLGQAQIFAEITGAAQQTLYATSKAELEKWRSIIKMTSSFMKRIMSVSQFITGTTLS